MDTQENIISSRAKLSAIAGIMFFAPFVNSNVNSDLSLSDDERNFIMWYVKVWFVNLIFFVLTAISFVVNIFYFSPILYWIAYIWSFAVYIITVFSVFACANGLPMRDSNESVIQDIQNKDQLLKVFVPCINFSLRFKQQDYSMPYRWLKESVLLRTCFIFWTTLLWSPFWLWILIIIWVRLILLLINIDIISVSMKKSVNWLFSCNPWEVMPYFSSYIISKIKKSDYLAVLQAEKLKYQQWQKFWIWIIVQYILFMLLLYFIHHWIIISYEEIILWVAVLLRIVRVFLFYKNKGTFPKIPIISEIVSLVFK